MQASAPSFAVSKNPTAQRWWRDATAFVERHANGIGWLLVCLYVLTGLGDASQKFLWYDELVTVKAASLPTWKGVLDFFNQGRDTTSATCALIDHLALKLPMSPELSARLPFVLAFAAMLVFASLFVRRRYPSTFALSAGMLLFSSKQLRYFGVEARGYVLMMAGTALALYCWQVAATKPRSRFASVLGLWFGLAFALNAHTFAVLIFLPFALAQWVRDRERRSVDWPMWLAILLMPLGLLPVWHGQHLAQGFYGHNFWAKPQMMFLFYPYILIVASSSMVLLAVVLCYLAWVAFGYRKTMSALQHATQVETGFSRSEWVLVLMLTTLPLYALPFSYLIHVYRPFYVLEFVVGFYIMVTALLAELGDRSRQAGSVLLAGMLLYTASTAANPVRHGLTALLHPSRAHPTLVATYNSQPWVRLLEGSALPIVASEHLTYTLLDFYGTPDITRRLWVLTDLADLAAQPKSETAQKNLILFGPVLGFRTEDAHQFFPSHREFLMAGTPDVGDWLTGYLLRQQGRGQANIVALGPEDTDPGAGLPNSDWDVRLGPSVPEPVVIPGPHQGQN